MLLGEARATVLVAGSSTRGPRGRAIRHQLFWPSISRKVLLFGSGPFGP
jgi:hypothetical protein